MTLSRSKRNKEITIAVLKGETYDNVGIAHNISRERVCQITRRLCLLVDPTIPYDIFRLRRNAKEIIPKIESM
ncbi:MAG: hypothetical protein WCR46_23300 [Deltaproteobacteria bacterium]